MKHIFIILLAFSFNYCANAQYTDLSNTQGQTIRARIVESREDSIAIETIQGKRFVLPLMKLSAESRAKIDRMSFPKFSYNLDLSTNPQTGKIRNEKYRIIIQLDGRKLIGMYPDEKGIIEEHLEKCARAYRTHAAKPKSEESYEITVLQESPTRVPENKEADLRWNMKVHKPSDIFKETSVTFNLPAIYSPIIFESYSIYTKDNFTSEASQRTKIYDTKADVTIQHTYREATGDAFSTPQNNTIAPIQIDANSLLRLYDYIQTLDTKKVVESGLKARQ